MFYSTTFLNRKDGKFSIIWLVATKAKKLKRRDYESVDITKTCNDILKCLPHAADVRRVTYGHGRKQLLSLYLSSQLLYGVVLVFDKQQKYFLDDLKQVIDSIRRLQSIGGQIDLDQSTGQNIDMADPLLALDPAFLEKFGRPGLPIPYSPSLMDFGDQDYYKVNSARTTNEEDLQPRYVVPREAITLPEDDWRFSPSMGMDNEEFPNVEDIFQVRPEPPPPIEINIGDDFETEIPPIRPLETTPPRKQRVEAPNQPTTQEPLILGSQPADETEFIQPQSPMQPPPAPHRVMPEPEPDVTPAPERRPRARRPPPIVFELNPIQREDMPVRTPRRRKRGVLAMDPETKIPALEMQRQTEDLIGNTRPFAEIIVDVDAMRQASENLLEIPSIAVGTGLARVFTSNFICRQEEVVFADIFASTPFTIARHEAEEYIEAQPPGYQPSPVIEEPTEDQYQPIDEPMAEEPIPIVPPAAETTEPMDELSEAERDRLNDSRKTSGVMTSVTGEAETIDKDRVEEGIQEQQFGEGEIQDQPPMEEIPAEEPPSKRRRTISPPPEDHLAKCYPPVPDMPNSTAQSFALQREELQNIIYDAATDQGDTTTFEVICPIGTASPIEAAKMFYLMLDLCGSGVIMAYQDDPYGTITIQCQ